jgi:predicted HAD superfamily phosphohydrolase YqeG
MNMGKNLDQNIVELENNILDLENTFLGYSQMQQKQQIREFIGELKSELKYLAVQTNGIDIDKVEYRKIMDFLRVHYNFLQEHLTYSKTLA